MTAPNGDANEERYGYCTRIHTLHAARPHRDRLIARASSQGLGEEYTSGGLLLAARDTGLICS